MDKYKKTFRTWNKIAQLYENKFMDLELYNDSYDVFCELLNKENARVLELGCGPGNITKYILSKYPNLNILGIDVAANMIELARKNNPTVDFKIMDGRNIHTLEMVFDGLVCGFYLPYLSNKDRLGLFNNCKKLLTEKGILYLSFVAGEYKDSGYLTGSTGDSLYFYYHDLDEIKKELTRRGFSILSVMYKDYNRGEDDVEIHTIILARK